MSRISMLIVFISFIFSFVESSAIITASAKVGVIYSQNFYFHNLSLNMDAGFPSCCPQFPNHINSDKSGWGVFCEIPIYKDKDILQFLKLDIHYGAIPAEMKSKEPVQIDIDGEKTLGTLQKNTSVDHKMITFNPAYKLAFREIGLGLFLGPGIGYAFDDNYKYEERIIEPQNLSGTVNQMEGEIPDFRTIRYSIIVGADFTLDTRPVGFCVQLSYRLGLDDLTDNIDWKTDCLSAGVKVFFEIF